MGGGLNEQSMTLVGYWCSELKNSIWKWDMGYPVAIAPYMLISPVQIGTLIEYKEWVGRVIKINVHWDRTHAFIHYEKLKFEEYGQIRHGQGRIKIVTENDLYELEETIVEWEGA